MRNLVTKGSTKTEIIFQEKNIQVELVGIDYNGEMEIPTYFIDIVDGKYTNNITSTSSKEEALKIAKQYI